MSLTRRSPIGKGWFVLRSLSRRFRSPFVVERRAPRRLSSLMQNGSEPILAAYYMKFISDKQAAHEMRSH